jgi:hypothetical protein
MRIACPVVLNLLIVLITNNNDNNKKNSVALDRKRIIPAERPPLVGEVNANIY